MPHRGIGAKGVQALAPPIAVSIQRAYLAKINKVLILCLSSGVRWGKNAVSGVAEF